MTLADSQAVATQLIIKEMPDLLAKSNGGWAKIAAKPQMLEGATYIQWPVFFQENAAQAWITGTQDVLDLNPNQNLTNAQLNWKFFYMNAPVTLQDEVMTADTDKAVFDLVTSKVKLAAATWVRTMSSALYASGTSANMQINGFADIFAASGTAYAGLNNTSTGLSGWLPQIDTSTQTITYAAINNMIASLAGFVNQTPSDEVATSTYAVDLLLSNFAVQAQFAAINQTQQRFVSVGPLKAGFMGIEVNGIPWVADTFSPGTVDNSTADNYLYVLSTESMKLGVRYGFGTKKRSSFDNAQTIPNQPIKSQIQFDAGNLICYNRRVNGVFKTLIAGATS